MAHIEIITHTYDHFIKRTPRSYNTGYLLGLAVKQLLDRGHHFTIINGVEGKTPSGDIAIMHVDASIVPQEYLDYAARFPLCINGKVRDITKRNISSAAVSQNDGWSGPVIVKSNYNCYGAPELTANRRAVQHGRPLPFPHVSREIKHYPTYGSMSQIPPDVWTTSDLAVEKFIPESDPRGYAVRVYTFFGDCERCTRYVAIDHMVKAENHVHKELIEPPEAIRRKRQELGFDYGKFEFVIHDGEVFLLDANKTPAAPDVITPPMMQGANEFANQIERFCKRA